MTAAGVSAYAYIFARVRSMIGELLPEESYVRLNACPNLNVLLFVLGNTSYGKILKKSQDTSFTSRRASYEIRKKLSSSFQTIIKHSPDYAQPLLIQLFKLYEVDNLKAVLRGIAIHEAWDKIRFTLFPMEDYPTLPFEEMAKSGSIEESIPLLYGTDYYRVIQHALDRYLTEENLFPLEVALDLNYWQDVWRLVNSLPQTELTTAKKLIGLLIDKNNLTWAARYRLYHKLSESEIINYTLPFGYKVDDTIIRAIASGKDINQVVSEVFPSIMDGSIQDSHAAKQLPWIEIQMTRMIQQSCHTTFSRASFNIGLLLAYLFSLEIEIQDLTLLIEAKALDIPAAVYGPYMIHTIPSFGKN